ncbi:ABC transporter ATP-binding protein [Fulvivirga sp. M361]|uniref:ABC transporter ATP-binding protein n=1 Tax=Fulvivirga sp. M361 TaxID=2594266 RepID=UPI00117AAB33|nr:ABC transporter ATP-binding protein [Fulvivirga sp. M361]TRX55614.1 ABC transporter ATP-binding protein [Fulvivirga sp. M361]
MDEIAIKANNLGKKFAISHLKSADLRNAFDARLKKIFQPKAFSKEEFWALKDISFEIKKGEAVGIIGRNGAGKSTLLKILSRITEPSSGRFEINGRVSSLLEVGTGFHMELTGRENIYLNGTILGMKRAEIKNKFDEIVSFSGVEKFIDTPVKHYSSGMKVRLAFSVAAHLEPEILIIDEVLAVGDAEFQKKCLGKMSEVSKNEGRTVLFVSHNLGAVKSLCSRSILLQDGYVKRNESTSIVLAEYLNQFDLKSKVEFEKRADLPSYFESLMIFDHTKTPNKTLDVGKPYSFVIKLVVRENCNNVVLGIGIKNLENMPVRTVWDRQNQLVPGVYEFSFQEETVFYCTGQYKITLGLTINGTVVQYLEDILSIEVDQFADKDKYYRTDLGIIVNQMKVNLKKVG